MKEGLNIQFIEGLSAHLDQEELLYWISEFKTRPDKILITHGELDSAKGLKAKLLETDQLERIIPELNSQYAIPVYIEENETL